MERVPTQTDLIRLCDAVDSFHDYYQNSVAKSRGLVQHIDERLAEIERLVCVLPKPKWFFFSFDSVGIPHVEPNVKWQGWQALHWTRFLTLIEACRAVVLAWYEIKIDADPELKPLQTVGRLPGSKVETLVAQMTTAAFAFREALPFTPCEEQEDILSALNEKSRTAEELMALCHISKSRLYGRRQDKNSGGLNELMRLDMIRNGQKDGSGISGYYRPDRPPE
jgi:hypothetical protein